MQLSPILLLHISGGITGILSGAVAMSFRKGSGGHARAAGADRAHASAGIKQGPNRAGREACEAGARLLPRCRACCSWAA